MASMAALARRATQNKSVLPAPVKPNYVKEISAIRPKSQMQHWSVKMTIPIADQTVKTAIPLQAMPYQAYACPMALAKSRNAHLDIISITMLVKQTASQTAASMTYNVISKTLTMNVKTRCVRLHANPIITYITMHVKQTASKIAANMAHNAILSKMQIMNVKTMSARLHANPTFTHIMMHVKQIASKIADHMEHSAILSRMRTINAKTRHAPLNA